MKNELEQVQSEGSFLHPQTVWANPKEKDNILAVLKKKSENEEILSEFRPLTDDKNSV